jgi:hypothetical protein
MDDRQQEQALAQLRETIEKVVDRKMKTPKDFDFLSGCIFETLHSNISATTLKRIWGYLAEPTVPRLSTLNLLAQFVGADNWEAFCQQSQNLSSASEPVQIASDEVHHKKSSHTNIRRIAFIVFPLLLIVGGIVYYLYIKSQPDIISFADPAVKALCVAHWDTDGDGELSYEETALVTDLKDFIREDTTITSFDELQYFTGLTSIGECAFSGCNHLTSVVLPNQVKSIDAYAFAGCSKLTLIIFPDNVTRIDLYAFLDCTSLTELHIPQSVTHIGEAAFNGTSGVTTITVDERNPIYDSRNNCNAIIETAANKLVAGCCATVIPTDVTIIDNYAWGGCWSLKSIRLPKNILRIEHGAFNWAITLNAVVSEIKVPFQFEEEAFDHIGGECTLTVPHGTRDAYIAAGWTEEIFKGGIMEANE